MAKIADRVQETTTTTGTGTYTLAGAVTGFQTFNSAFANLDSVEYAITNGIDWEVGQGVFTSSGTTLSRATILASSNANAAVNWGTDVKNIWSNSSANLLRSFLPLAGGTMTGNLIVNGSTIPQNSKSAAYTTVLGDANGHLLHPTADNNARTFTIDSNANVAYVIGTAISFVNQINVLTIAITSDTMTLMGAGSTGSRTLAANGIATALKVSATGWVISGTNLT